MLSRKNYVLFIPRNELYPLLFSFRKESEAALIERVRERRGRLAEHGRRRGSHGRVRITFAAFRATPSQVFAVPLRVLVDSSVDALPQPLRHFQ